ncbi:MAG: DedA family protein [Alphaproteobacteria bacterium]|nr:MAG: DedA family protein [Alphaproteobacteria bacterium]
MLHRLYNWTIAKAQSPHAERALFGIAFIESSFFPLPPDVLLIPMCLADRARSFRFAALCTVASVLGGLFGYLIGHFLFETIGQNLIDLYGLHEQFAHFQNYFHQYGWWIIVLLGLTPFPYKVVAISSGLVGLNPLIFASASLLIRGARFNLEAFLLYRYGEAMRRFIEKYLPLLTLAFFALLLSGILAVKYLL